MSANERFNPPRAELLDAPEPTPRQPWSAWLLQGAALVLASAVMRALLAEFGVPMGFDHAPPDFAWSRVAAQVVVFAGLVEVIRGVRRRARWAAVAGAIAIGIGIVAIAAKYGVDLEFLGRVRSLRGLGIWSDMVGREAWLAFAGLALLVASLWHLLLSTASRRWFWRA